MKYFFITLILTLMYAAQVHAEYSDSTSSMQGGGYSEGSQNAHDSAAENEDK